MNHSQVRFLRDGSMLRWFKCGPLKFQFIRFQLFADDYLPVVKISFTDNTGYSCSGIYRECEGGWLLIGYPVGSKPSQIGYISMSEWSRLEIINSLT